jgi:hypothetical protein
MKSTDKIQNLLPIGYLFLVILGLVKETVFYFQIGINFLEYSAISDILMSPIATITYHPFILTAIISLFIFHYHLPSILAKYGQKKWVQKAFELEKNTHELSDEALKSYYFCVSIKSLALVLISFFLGYGIGGGYDVANQIEQNKVEFKSKLSFNTGETEEIYIIGSNSLYYFYLSKDNKSIKIAPIGAIKSLELVNKKRSK